MLEDHYVDEDGFTKLHVPSTCDRRPARMSKGHFSGQMMVDLFCKDSAHILRALKSLMQGDGAVIVILSGTAWLSEVIRSEPQVQRRFSVMNLRPVCAATQEGEFHDIIDEFYGVAGLNTDL